MTMPDSESPSSLARRLLAGEMDDAVEAAAKAIAEYDMECVERYGEGVACLTLENCATDRCACSGQARAALEAAAPSLLTALLGELEEKRAECERLNRELESANEESTDRLHRAWSFAEVLHQIARLDLADRWKAVGIARDALEMP